MKKTLNGINGNHFITGIQVLIFAMLVILPTAALSEDEYVCDGKYKDGGKPTEEELKKILSDHKAWLDSGRKEGDKRRANLCKANLSRAYLSEVNLSWAYLFEANLSSANLSGTTLVYANLDRADLYKANLSGANLSRSYLSGTVLNRANLNGAVLNEANLSGADLYKANLSGADLSGAYLNDANLFEANLSGAKLNGVNLNKANLSRAYLSEVNLSWAYLFEANLFGTNLSGADLYKANLSRAYLSEANLSGVNLSGAILNETNLSGADLSKAKFTKVNLKETIYTPTSSPDKRFLNGIENLKTVNFIKGKYTGLVLLRKSLKEVGLRGLEREATYALEKGKTGHLSPSLEKYSRLVFFEWTGGYGLYPGRCLIILLCLIPVFTIFYLFSIFKEREYRNANSLGENTSGIYRIWSKERIRKNLGSNEPDLVSEELKKSIGYALYFSLLSAFHIGWRDINVGSWIARIQPREYTLQATGWVRTVSGIQSLISIYLLAFWVLTQFGRPFD